MSFLEETRSDEIATITLSRGKVNALNNDIIDELKAKLTRLEADSDVRAVILRGQGRFFSFGFDIPAFLSFSKEEFQQFLINFTGLYTSLFLYPKPVVAALNGHTIAGGCMLALACDHRVMVTGKAKISLNEIGFGSSVFAGSTEMLRFWIGSAGATQVLYSGAMFSAEEAKLAGLVHEVATDADLMEKARAAAAELAGKSLPTFTSIKHLLRKPVAAEMALRERDSIREFVDIWYSPATWAKLQEIKIF